MSSRQDSTSASCLPAGFGAIVATWTQWEHALSTLRIHNQYDANLASYRNDLIAIRLIIELGKGPVEQLKGFKVVGLPVASSPFPRLPWNDAC